MIAKVAVRGTVVLDGDDTLWVTEPLYDEARSACRTIVQAAGLDGGAWEAAQRQIDIANHARLGVTRARFPTSCREAYESVCRSADRTPEPGTARRIYDAAARVFDMPAPLVPDARAALAELSALVLVLLTKGDRAVQQKRIDQSGLAEYFQLISIVQEKTPADFLRALSDLGSMAKGSWSIGNSVRSDILPASEIGMSAIWVPAHVWELEHSDGAPGRPGIHTAASLTDAAQIILSGGA